MQIRDNDIKNVLTANGSTYTVDIGKLSYFDGTLEQFNGDREFIEKNRN